MYKSTYAILQYIIQCIIILSSSHCSCLIFSSEWINLSKHLCNKKARNANMTKINNNIIICIYSFYIQYCVIQFY